MRSTATTLRWLTAALIALYSFVIFRLTLLPPTAETGTFRLLYRLGARLGFDTAQTEALANVALFIPAGFLLAIFLGRTWAGTLVGVLGSCVIEVSQAWFLPTRVPSFDDVLHNGLGALIGALVAWPIARWLRHAGARERARSAPAPDQWPRVPRGV